jgi:hypothetical protein
MTERGADNGTLSPRQVLLAVLVISTLIRLWLSFRYFGFNTGDDVEILQAGFMRALDLPYVPWKIRNLFVSDIFVAPVLALASWLGIESVRLLIWIATLPFVALSTVNVYLVYALGRRWLDDHGAAALAAGLYAFHWLPLGYGATAHPRTAAVTCVLIGALLIASGKRGFERNLAAGALIGVAFAIRYSEIIFLLPMLACAFVSQAPTTRKLIRAAALCAGCVLATLVTVGLHDLLTWGRPFSSLIEFARYTLIEQQASARVRVQPWYWYLWRLPKWLPLTVLPMFAGQRDLRWLRFPALYALLPLLMLSLIHHKEMRYLQGVIPFVCIATAGAVYGWWRLGRRRATVVLMVLSLGFGVAYPGFVRKQSMAAVLAARSLAETPGVSRVALSQLWAYGANLYLAEGVELRELPVHPTIVDLEDTVPGCRHVGLYRDHLSATPELELWLADNGYESFGTFEWGRSRAVVIFAKAPEPDREHPDAVASSEVLTEHRR